MIEKRLFVGNLPLNVRRKEIKRKFSGYGNVLDVEVKHRMDNEDNVISTFAFVNIKAYADDLNNCVNELPHQDWNGHTIKIEYAKESFLTRLEKERQENQDGRQLTTLNNLKCKTESHSDSESKPTKILSLHDSLSTSEKVESINEHAKFNGKLKMFTGTGSSQAQTNVADKNGELKSSKRFNGDVIMKHFEAFSDIWKDLDGFDSNTMNVKNFRSINNETDTHHNENNYRQRTHQKDSNFGFEIVKNEIKREGVVKPYLSSGSDSEGSYHKRESNVKVLNKGAKKFKKDVINDVSHSRTNVFTSKSTPFRNEDKREAIWNNRRRGSNNLDEKDKKQVINGHIEGDTMDIEEVDQSLISERKRVNPISQVSEERRQKSVLEKLKAVSEQKRLIKIALRQADLENRINKKIVFCDDDDGYDGGSGGENDEESDDDVNFASKKSVASKKRNDNPQNLFDDSSDTDVNEEMGKLKINKQFEGSKGEKLLELQSRYAHDDRFALDSRFYESDNDDSDHEGSKNRSNFKSNTDEKDEVTKQLEVLEDVLGYQITKRPESDKKKKHQEVKQDTSLLRFDPTKLEHSKYVITKSSSTSDTTMAKPRKKNQEIVIDVPKNQTEVSKERFYKIDDSLKKSLKRSSAKSSGFSVLELIGSKPDDDKNKKNENNEGHFTTEPTTSLPFKPKYQPSNPFRYDSSDTEEEEQEKQASVHDNKQPTEEDNVAPFFGLWTDTFFLKDKDSRLKEADDFFTKYNTDDDEEKGEMDFAKRRKYLKSIVKWKSRNNLKNQAKQQFKVKLGGNSKNVRRKNKNISWKVKKFQNRRQ